MNPTQFKPPTLDELVERSLCSIQKSKMTSDIPVLSTHDSAAIDQWRDVLLSLTLGKGKASDTIDTALLGSKLATCIKSLGTHGSKIPNPDVDSPPIWRTVKTDQIHTQGIIMDSSLPDVITYSGNAGDVPVAKFLMATISLDGMDTTVWSELKKGKTSPITQSLMRSVITDEHLQVLATNDQRNSHLPYTPIHPLQKQIYFCCEGFEDVIIIPVSSANMIVALHAQSQKPGRRLRRELCKVGGENPVNGGSLCSDLGGNFQLFLAEPPSTQIQNQTRRMLYGGPIYVQSSVSAIDVQTFIANAPLQSSTGNLENRLAEHQNYEWFAQVLLQSIFDVKDKTELLPYESTSESPNIVKYINSDQNLISDVLCSNVALDVIERVKRNHKSLNLHMSDKTIRDALVEKMIEALL